MAPVPANFDKLNIPWCEKCNRPVERFEIQYPVSWRYQTADDGFVMVRTGEVIVTISCHGDMWKVSTWFGTLAQTIRMDI